MTQPVAPGTPPVVPVAAREGKVYLTSPVTGETRETDPTTAAQLLQSGWVPNSETGAEALRAGQIPGEVAAEQPGLGKFGYGVARGVGTPLVDLALPAGNRVHEVLSEDSPWLTGGGEAVGMIGSALLGVGPVASLEQGAARVTAGIGAGNGLVRTAFGRAAEGALVNGAYGAMTAVSEAHDQNVPLTAQRLGSEVLPGLLFGGVLGGTLGAVEGGLGRFAGKSGTLPERIASADKGKLDEIFKAGVSDEDALRLANRELGVKDPGALTRFQALASGGDVTPERLVLLKDSGPAGVRARADAFASGERLAEAERAVLDKGNDYLLGREEAMKQLVGDIKGEHIGRMVGAGTADAEDIARIVREQVADANGLEAGVENYSYLKDGMRPESLELARKNFGADRPIEVGMFPGERPALQDGRHRLAVAKEKGAASMRAKVREYDAEGNVIRERETDLPVSGDGRRGAFVDKALDRMPPEVLRELERSMGASRDLQITGIGGKAPAAQAGNLRERLISGLREGHKETIGALESALSKAKLTDEQLHGFGAQGAWANKPMDFIQKWRGAIEQLNALPKGVNESAGEFKQLLGNLEHAEQSVLRDPRAVAAHQLDTLKKRLADFADAGERLGAGSGVAATARGMYEDLRLILEDPTVWGPKFAGFQSRVNQLVHQNVGVAGEFDNLFVKQIGKPDPDAPWRNARVVDSEKVSKALQGMSEPKQLEQLNRLRAHLDDQKAFFKEQLDSLQLGPKAHVRIQAGIKQIDQLKESIDTAVYLNTAQRQGKALLGFGPLGSGWEARAALGAVVGGPVGAVAGLAMSAALNPGKMLQFRAIAERMAESTGSRVWLGISKLLGLKVGDAAKAGAGFIGKTAASGAKHQGKAGMIVQAMLSERGEARARTYSQTVQQLIEARQRLPELLEHLDATMPTMEQALPGTRAQMMAQAQRGMDYVINHLPVMPKMRLYGEHAAPLSDHDYENFLRMTMGATDPPSILEMAAEGELTPNAVAAAEAAAPDFVAYIRSEMVRAISDVGPDAVPYSNRISASLVIGTPLDESLEPENIAIQQATHQKRRELAAKAKENRGGGGSGGETGVNEQYSSKSDQIERGAPPR